jgi:hypothetical protein
MPKNEDTLAYFKRYSKFYLNGDKTCWRVEAIDWISTPGVLEVSAIEYYANDTEDDIENGIVGGLIVEPEIPESDSEIIGETFIKIKKRYKYEFKGSMACEWSVSEGAPVKLIFDENDPRKVEVCWTSAFSG